MAYKLVVTRAAHQDLDETLAYIARQLGNPTAAGKLLEQVEACYDQLRTFPYLYEACRDPRLNGMGYRKTTVGNYILIFRPSESDQTVYILRFFYGGRDYEKLL